MLAVEAVWERTRGVVHKVVALGVGTRRIEAAVDIEPEAAAVVVAGMALEAELVLVEVALRALAVEAVVE